MTATHTRSAVTDVRSYVGNSPDRDYLWIPTRLLDTLYDSPLAIGLYVLIARRWLADGSADGLPLSDADVLRYDPQLGSRGSLRRAIQRLELSGWIATVRVQGAKTRYTPTWGKVRGVVKCWSKTVPSLGRGHVQTQRVSRLLLDDYLGRLLPHPKAPAQVERYQTTPIISLKDVGIYILTLRHRDTAQAPALEEARLCHQAEPLTVPPTRDTLARTELSRHGMRRIGLLQVGPKPRPKSNDPRQTVFFVAPHMIGHMIGHMITDHAPENTPFDASECDKQPIAAEQKIPTGMLGMLGIVNPPTPTDNQKGGGQVFSDFNQENQPRERGDAPTTKDQQPQCSNRPRRRREIMSIPATPSAQRLQVLGVRPAQCIEFADIAAETLEAAIADAQARPKIRDQAGWVVSLLRDVRDHGWDLALRKRGTVPDNAGPSLGQIQATIERAKASGGWTIDTTSDSVSSSPATPPVTDETVALLSRAKSTGFFGPREDLDGKVPVAPSAEPQVRKTPVAPAPALDQATHIQPGTHRSVALVEQFDERGRPSWINPADWQALPALVRGVLRGSVLRAGTVIAADPWRQGQLARYEREVEALVTAAGGCPPQKF